MTTTITTTVATATWAAVDAVIPVIWPASLPQVPLLRGFSQVPNDNVIRTAMSYGPPKQRKRVTNDLYSVSIALVLTPAQMATLDNFYKDTGAQPFNWKNFQDDPKTTAVYLFTAPPMPTPVGRGFWRVTLQLEME